MQKTQNPAEALMSNVLWSEMKKYIVQSQGEIMIKKIAEQSSEDLGKFLNNMMLPVSSKQGSFLVEFYKIWKKIWPDPTGAEMTQMIRWVGKQNLNTLMTVFLKIGTPNFIVNRFPFIWDHFFNYGKLEITAVANKNIEYQLTDTTPYGEGVCKGTTGWTWAALEQSGAKNVKMEHTECIFRGRKRCLFKGSWE